MKKAIKAFLALFFLILTVSGALAAETTKKPEIKTVENSIGMTFVYIKPGTFMMGSPAGEPGRGRDSDETLHQVTLTHGFYMQTTEVTQGQWRSVTGSDISYFKNCGDDCPVEQVSWNDAQEFIRRLNKKEGGSRYRLPTEAEWEYAARAGTTTPFNTGTGNCLSTDQANYNGSYPISGCSKGEDRQTTVKTGSFSPNAWGLYDMHGNVFEWCQDWYGDYPSGSITDPDGPTSGSSRVSRGCAWMNSSSRLCRSAYRNFLTATNRSGLGFRLVMTP
jgi:formylglycine-generating enzyme required for sulfatase activity